MNGLQKISWDNLLEIWRTRWRWMRKGDLKGCTKACVVSRNSSYGLTKSSTILTKLLSHPFVGCAVQEMRLYLI